MMERVVLAPYDPQWPLRFARERAALEAALAGAGAVIEHIGSTAVPGLVAKPVIDLMLGVPDLAEATRRIAALEAEGYEYVPAYERQIPERRYFRKPWRGPRAYHLHAVVEGGRLWTRHLAFRDHLRAHPESAAAYAELKRELASRCNKIEYTDAKRPFIDAVLASVLGREDCREGPIHDPR